MRYVFVLLLMCCLLASGCAKDIKVAKGIDVYTFQKDRVDQELRGNQGFVEGQSSDADAKPRKTKRTLIGIDVEVPSSLVGEGKNTAVEGDADTIGSGGKRPVTGKSSSSQVETVVVEQETFEEDKWIK